MSKNPSSIIIFGAANVQGKTFDLVQKFNIHDKARVVDLNQLNISFFDYKHRNENDDYLSLMEDIVKYDNIILATPVYWYSVSTIMKVFIDRLSDCISIRKDLGRKLRGKKLYVISTYGTTKPRGLEDMFEQICEYMDMEYGGTYFHYTGDLPELQTPVQEYLTFQKNIFGE